MRIFTKPAKTMLLILGLTGAISPAFADPRDEHADSALDAVTGSTAVLVRVPVDTEDREDSNAAEMRVITSTDEITAGKLPEIWDRGTAINAEAAAPTDRSTDASTWWGWGSWSGWGWRQPYYYYYYYTPSFNYYGSYYNYYGSYFNRYPYYYSSYYPYGSYWGYRYYYYPRYW